MSTSPPKLPPLPQENPIAGQGGLLTLPWNLFFVELLRYIQSNTNAISGLALTAGQGGGGVAAAGAAPAVDLTDQASSEGILNLGARADHRHLKLIGAEDDGTDLGSVSAVNVIGSGLDVEIEPNLTGSLLTDLYAYWPLNEVSGTRYKTLGSATSADLLETSGAVASEAGRFGLAATGGGNILQATLTPVVSALNGVTVAQRFKMTADVVGDGKAQSIFRLWNSGASGGLAWSRANIGGVQMQYGWLHNTDDDVEGGGFSTAQAFKGLLLNEWYVIIMWADMAGFTWGAQINDGHHWKQEFPILEPAKYFTANTFDVFALQEFGMQIFDGPVDAPLIWTRALSVAERERVAVNFRANVSVNPFALETFGGM